MSDIQVLSAALEFLSRVDLNAKEALTFIQTIERLAAMRAQLVDQAPAKTGSDD